MGEIKISVAPEVSKVKYRIVVCSHREVKSRVAYLLADFLQNNQEYDLEIWEHDALISRSRSKASSEFLKSNLEILLFIDDDIVFNKSFIHSIIEHAKTLKIVGGWYPCKGKEWPAQSPMPGQTITIPSKTVSEAKYLATGFMAVHREVFENLAKKINLVYPKKKDEVSIASEYYPFFLQTVVGEEDLSEDYYFCHIARELCGYKLWLDNLCACGHIGERMIQLWDLYKTYNADFAKALAAQVNKMLLDKHYIHKNCFNEISELLVAIANCNSITKNW